MKLAGFPKGSEPASSEAPGTGPAAAPAKRESSLDMVKWLAMATMLVDHLRYLNEAWSGLYIPGRLAFPLFCLAIAANVARDRDERFPRLGHVRYLGWLLLFALLSEGPYRLYTGFIHPSNVLPTLALGLVVAWGVRYRTPPSLLAALGAAGLAAFLGGERVMYGVCGTLLPAAFLLALHGPWRGRRRAWIAPTLLAVLPHALDMRQTGMWLWHPYPLLVLGVAGAAPAFGLWLLSRHPTFSVPPVTRWGYGFYPGHLLALYGIHLLLGPL